jgi:PAS domain S-box-containing protein
MELEDVLEHINVPSYLIDASGIIRWVNPAARRIVGDVAGRQFTSVVAPENTRRARELFARKIVGGKSATDAGVSIVDAEGRRVGVEITSVPVHDGEHVVGVFGQVSDIVEEPHTHPDLSSRRARPRCSSCSSGGVRRSRSPTTCTSAPRRSEITSATCFARSGPIRDSRRSRSQTALTEPLSLIEGF